MLNNAGAPFSFDYQNFANCRVSPSAVHTRNTVLHNYFCKYLMQKAMSVYKWGLPDEWDTNYFLYVLYTFGYVAVINTDRYGVIPQQCTLTGYNVMYQPTRALISNPLLRGNLEPRIHKQCELIKLQPNYSGIWDAVTYFADMMALASESIGVNLVNSKLAYLFAANGKAQAETLKKLYDNVAEGNPAVFVNKNAIVDEQGNPAMELFQQNLSQNYIVDKLLVALRNIENQFCTFVGIPSANTDKRERLVTDEVNSNNVETQARADMWLESLQDGCDKANRMFGLDLSVKWRVDPHKGEEVTPDGNVNSRSV